MIILFIAYKAIQYVWQKSLPEVSTQNQMGNTNYIKRILHPDLPVEIEKNVNFNIRENLYLKCIYPSSNLFFSINSDNFILTAAKIPVILHNHNAYYLLPSYRQAFRNDNSNDNDFIEKRNLNNISFIVINYDDNTYYLELEKMDKGYILKRRIHQCGDYGIICINKDHNIGFDLHDTNNNSLHPAIFRLENDNGEFINI